MPTASPPPRTILSRARGASPGFFARARRSPLKCDGEESECKCVEHDGNIDRRVDFYTHGFVFENENKQVCLPAGA